MQRYANNKASFHPEGGFVFTPFQSGLKKLPKQPLVKIKYVLSKIILAFIYLRISYNRTGKPSFYRPGLSVISYPVWHFGKYFYG